MPLSRSSELRYLRGPLDGLILLANHALLPIVLSSAWFVQSEKITATGDPDRIIYAAASVIVMALASYLPRVHAWRNSLIRNIQRTAYLYIATYRNRTGSAIARRLFDHIAIPEFQFERIRHRSQEKAVKAILNKITSPGPRSLIFLEGNSGAGKTTVVQFLLSAIVRDESLLKRVRRTLYFDFAQGESQQSAFFKMYPTSRSESALIVIDNFHMLSIQRLREFTRLVLHATESLERCMVLMSQPLANIKAPKHLDLQIIKTARSRGDYLRLDAIEIEDLRETLPQLSLAEVRAILKSDEESAPLLNIQFSRTLQKRLSRRAPFQEVLLELESQGGDGRGKPPRLGRVLKVLSCIVALSIHRGVFSWSELRKASRHASKGGLVRGHLEYFLLRRDVRELIRTGFVMSALSGSGFLIFHERLAVHYKDKYYDRESFRRVFDNITESLESAACAEKDWLAAWLYSIERQVAPERSDLFDLAICEGHFSTMLRNLERNSETSTEASTEILYQLGFLSEKTGRFEEARIFLRRALEAEASHGHRKIIAEKICLALTEAEHHPEAVSDMRELLRSSDSVLVQSLARYWIYHIKMHHGVFNVGMLKSLADSALENHAAMIAEDPYLASHFARRLYFDLLRIYYLEGSGDYRLFRELKSHPLGILVAQSHPEHKAFYHKFVSAHYVHYEVLFELGVFRKRPREIDHQIVPETRDLTIESLRTLAAEYYSVASKEFDVFGDKAKEYIAGRVAELCFMDPECDFLRLEIQIREFHRFISNAGFTDMMAWLHMYDFKFCFLKAFRSLASADAPAESKLLEHDQLIRRANEKLSEALETHENFGNNFGVTRTQMFRHLVNFVANGNKDNLRDGLLDLRRTCERRRYGREVRVIDFVLSKDGLTTAELLDVVSFYPVVYQ